MTNKILIPTVTIGIPTYNESPGILLLLDDICMQIKDNFVLTRIIINDDASTDDIHKKVAEYNNLTELWQNNNRIGVAGRLNEIFAEANTDILVILNGDIRLAENSIALLVRKIKEGYDLVSGNIEPDKKFTQTPVQKILETGMYYKQMAIDNFNEGNHYLTCHGPLRAFSKKLYTNLKIPNSVGEDTYSYLYATKNKYKYYYEKAAKAYFILPANFSDHLNQSARYYGQKKIFIKLFGKEFTNNIFSLPKISFIYAGARIFIKRPIFSLLYLALTIVSVVAYYLKFSTTDTETWRASSTKKSENTI